MLVRRISRSVSRHAHRRGTLVRAPLAGPHVQHRLPYVLEWVDHLHAHGQPRGPILVEWLSKLHAGDAAVEQMMHRVAGNGEVDPGSRHDPHRHADDISQRIHHRPAGVTWLHITLDLHGGQLTVLIHAQARHRAVADRHLPAQLIAEWEADDPDPLRLPQILGRLHVQRRGQARLLDAQHSQVDLPIDAQKFSGITLLLSGTTILLDFDTLGPGSIGMQHADDVGVGQDDVRFDAEEAASLPHLAVAHGHAQVDGRAFDLFQDFKIQLDVRGRLGGRGRRRGYRRNKDELPGRRRRRRRIILDLCLLLVVLLGFSLEVLPAAGHANIIIHRGRIGRRHCVRTCVAGRSGNDPNDKENARDDDQEGTDDSADDQGERQRRNPRGGPIPAPRRTIVFLEVILKTAPPPGARFVLRLGSCPPPG